MGQPCLERGLNIAFLKNMDKKPTGIKPGMWKT
jgi:hypothetical protein